jgi:Zn-dependent protease
MESDKPSLPKTNQQTSMNTMILSVVAFVVLFYLFISNDILLIGLLVAVLFIHELGHYLTMKHYKYENLTMLFIPFLGAVVHGKKTERYSEKERANILLAGPIPGIVMGAILLLFGLDAQNAYLIFAATLFIMINALNLIPIDPLDGGQLLYMLFFGKREDWRLYYLFGSSLLTIGLGLYFQNYIVVGFGFLMGIRVRSYQKNMNIHNALKEEGIDYEKTY